MSYRFPLTTCRGRNVRKLLTTCLSWKLDFRLPLAALPRNIRRKRWCQLCHMGGRWIPALINCGQKRGDVFIWWLQSWYNFNFSMFYAQHHCLCKLIILLKGKTHICDEKIWIHIQFNASDICRYEWNNSCVQYILSKPLFGYWEQVKLGWRNIKE